MYSDFYCILSGLPELNFQPPYHYPEGVITEILSLLSEKDKQMAQYPLYQFDNYNIITMLNNYQRDFLPFGNYSRDELAAEIKTQDNLPEYLNYFFEKKQEQKTAALADSDELSLARYYYLEALKIEDSFLQQWSGFEIHLNNIRTAIQCRKYNIPLERREQKRAGQESGQTILGTDDLVDQLQLSHSADFGLTGVYDWMEFLIETEKKDLLTAEIEIEIFRWNKLDELVDGKYFSRDNLLVYIIKYYSLVRWNSLTQEKGSRALGVILDKITTNYSIKELSGEKI